MPRLALCLVLHEVSGGPVDPGYGIPGLPGGGGGPIDPGWGYRPPVDPGYGRPSWGGPVDPGYGRPDWGGEHPSNRPPFAPGHPGNWPPGSGVHPSLPIYHPDKPVPPGQSPGSGIWVIVYVPGEGFKWAAITPGVPEKPLPEPNPPGPAPKA